MANMNVSIVIVLSTIFNLLSYGATIAVPTTSTEFINSQTGIQFILRVSHLNVFNSLISDIIIVYSPVLSFKTHNDLCIQFNIFFDIFYPFFKGNFNVQVVRSKRTSLDKNEPDLTKESGDFIDNGKELPHFVHSENLTKYMAKATGSTAKIRCTATGKHRCQAKQQHYHTKHKHYCFLKGNPTPNITWTKDSNAIVRKVGTVRQLKWTIILENLTPNDSGSYTCKVCNSNGCIEYTTQIEVEGKLVVMLLLAANEQIN